MNLSYIFNVVIVARKGILVKEKRCYYRGMSDNLPIFLRLSELADRSFNNIQFTFTNFLSMGELSDYYTMHESKLSYAHPKAFGGTELSERKIIRFGSEKELGYSQDFPIVALIIKPLSAKFSDDLNHRDFLGSLMNLGIKRELLGDIFVKDNEGCLFCIDSIAEYIMTNLTKIKHTSVKVTMETDLNRITDLTTPDMKEKLIQVSSERADGVISRVFNLSRNASLELFKKELVFVNGRLCTENAKALKEEDIISVRGYGKFKLSELMSVSKKGKQNIKVLIYS